MAIDYARRSEMQSMSKEVRELYFSALRLKERLEPSVLDGELEYMAGLDAAYYRLDKALEEFQGEELTANNGSDNKN